MNKDSQEEKNGPNRQWGLALLALGLMLLVILIFVKSNYDSQAAFLCENIEASGGDMKSCPVHKTDMSWVFLAGFGVVVVLLMVGIYLSFIEKPDYHTIEKTTEKKPIIAVDWSRFDEDSKKIVEILQQHEGSAYQSDLVRQTGHSKVKITRILDKLESEKVIERKRRGMTNIVVLM